MRKHERLSWKQFCAIRKVSTKSYLRALKIRDYQELLSAIPGTDVLPPNPEEIEPSWYFGFTPPPAPKKPKQSVIEKQLEEIRKDREVSNKKSTSKSSTEKTDVPKRTSTKKTTRRKSSRKKEE